MQLKSIEIQGFKSFPDRLTIGFGEGITAIVGPNGSGKSNISDALRWVLGEQSTKTLRGAKMEDVIFGGTSTRKPVGFAEVSITIDNTQGELPVEFSEVVVTRRYFRSGESEFYINRQSCRLKDIHELFMDTGMGRDGYSVIGQGRITDVLASKSEDRREIFEEAAGISKYRYRKEAAEKRIEATELNLVRIRDITGELENQLEPLRLQAEKAKRYLALQEELRELEVDLWADALSRIKTARLKLEENVGVVTRELAESNAQMEETYALLESAGGQIAELDVELEKLREDMREKEARQAECTGERNVLAAKIAANHENITRLIEERGMRGERHEQLRAQLEAYEAEINETGKTVEALEKERAGLVEHYETLAKSSDDLNEKLSALGGLVADHEGQAALLMQELASLAATETSLAQRAAAVSEDIDKREALLAEQSGQLSAAQKRLDEGKEKMSAAQNVMSGYELRIATRRERLDKEREALARLEREQGAKTDRLNLLSDMERDYEGFSLAVKRVMQQSKRSALAGILGTVSELVSAGDDCALAIETALGAAMQNIVTQDENAAKRAILYLKNENVGRATFLPLSAIRGNMLSERGVEKEPGYIGNACELAKFDQKYRDIFVNLLGRTIIASDIDHAVNMAKKYGYRFRVVTLDGQVVNAGGSMTGGASARNTGLISRANEIRRLGEEIKALEKNIAERRAAAGENERELNAASYEYDLAANELREAENEVNGLEGGLESQRAHIEGIKADIAALHEEKQRVSAQSDECAARSNECARSLAERRTRVAELSASMDELAHGREGVLGEQGGLSGRLEDIRVALAENTAKGDAARRSADELRVLLDAIAHEKDSGEDMIGQFEEANRQLANADIVLADEIRDISARIEQLKESEQSLREKRLACEAARSKSEKDSRAVNERSMTLERERQRLERDRLNLDNEEQGIAERMWEDYELIPSRVRELAKPVEGSRDAMQKRVNALKNERRGMGSVNVDAAEEYEQVSSRYTFLVQQREDLEKSKIELEGIILEVTAEMEKIFAEKFKLIQESFSKTFTDMFGGGMAEVFLVDPEDALGSGIDIRVQPPGKMVKTISLFSGGEMALVAIALFFAIFKVRPAPFCILDEVDSALDEVNVSRFAKYISRLVPETQLIIITHRRGTMERADILYGVTMQEKGVSKLLTMNIREIERELNMKLE